MFANLIESASHKREYKRRSSFFLITVAAYALILSAAGVASVYAYDAQLEAQTSDLVLLNWVPPVTAAPKPVQPDRPNVRRPQTTNAPVNPNIRESIRTEAIARPDDPTKVPDSIGTQAPKVPPVVGKYRLGDTNVDPPTFVNNAKPCAECSSSPRVEVDSKPPDPAPAVVKPSTQRVSSSVLVSKVVSLPQPAYPPIAKSTRTQGPVNIQILVDEQGRVISAQVVAGNPMLNPAAKEAAMRARFTPTVLNGVPVKVQGVITYNFVLQ